MLLEKAKADPDRMLPNRETELAGMMLSGGSPGAIRVLITAASPETRCHTVLDIFYPSYGTSNALREYSSSMLQMDTGQLILKSLKQRTEWHGRPVNWERVTSKLCDLRNFRFKQPGYYKKVLMETGLGKSSPLELLNIIATDAASMEQSSSNSKHSHTNATREHFLNMLTQCKSILWPG